MYDTNYIWLFNIWKWWWWRLLVNMWQVITRADRIKPQNLTNRTLDQIHLPVSHVYVLYHVYMYECICAYPSVYVKNRISDQVHLTVSQNRTNRIQWDYPKTHLVVFKSWIINIYIKINIKVCVFWICSTGNGDNGLWGGWMTINKLKIQLIRNSSGFRVGLAGASLKVALTPQMHQELHWECIGTSVLMLMHPKIQMKNAKIKKYKKRHYGTRH